MDDEVTYNDPRLNEAVARIRMWVAITALLNLAVKLLADELAQRENRRSNAR